MLSPATHQTPFESALRSFEALVARLEALADAIQRPAPEFYSIKQAAAVVGVSPDHVRRAVTSGVLSASNVGTHSRPTYRISRGDLTAWVDRCKAGAIAPARRKVTPSRHHRPSSARSS